MQGVRDSLAEAAEKPKATLATYFETVVSVKLQELQTKLNDATRYLPSYDIRQSQQVYTTVATAMLLMQAIGD